MAEDRIGRASAFLASGTVVSRILGFVKAIVLAAAIGAFGVSADAFAIANQLPNTIYAIVAGGVLSAVLVPQIVRASVNHDGGAAYINKLVTLAVLVLAGTTLVATALAPVFSVILGPLLSAEQRGLVTAFAFWCLPQIFFYGLYTVLGEVLNARKSFGPFTWAPVINNIIAIAGLGVFIAMFGGDQDGLRAISDWNPLMIGVLGGSATLGILAQALVLFFFWRRVGLHYRPDFAWRGVGLGTAGRLAGWTFGMLLLTTAAGIIETIVAGGASGRNQASVAALQNAWLIFMLPHSVITVSIATAYYTRMSEHVARGRIDPFRADISASSRGIAMIIVLAAAVIGVCSYPFSAVFLSSFGQISASGDVVMAYIAGLLPFCLLFVVQRAFYALGDTRTPFFFTLAQTVIVTALVVSCGFLLPGAWIAVGIAASVSFACFIQLAIAAALLHRRMDGIDAARVLRSIGLFLGAVIVPTGVGVGLLVLLGGGVENGFAVASRTGAIASMVIIGTVMALLYLGILWLARSPELRAFAEPVLERIKRR